MNNEIIMCNLFGYNNCLFTNTGSSAFHSFLLSCTFKKGDEIIFPIECYPTFPMIAIQCGLKPIFVDIDDHYNLDPQKLDDEITDKTRFIVAIHMAGIPANMSEIEKIIEKHKNIILIEDSCQSAGTILLGGLKKSQLSSAIILSFSRSKLFSLGFGGALLTDNIKIYEKAKIVSNNGFHKTNKFICEGYSYRFEEELHDKLSILLNSYKDIVIEKQENSHVIMDEVGKYIPLIQKYNKKVLQHKVICEERKKNFMAPKYEMLLNSYKDVVENHYPKIVYEELFFIKYSKKMNYNINKNKFMNYLNKREKYLAFRINSDKKRLVEFLTKLRELE